MSTTRLKELDQILFTNSARNMPHLFWSNRGKNPVATRRTNPYLSTTAKPGIHQLARNNPEASSDVYRETTMKKEQSMRTGLLLLIASVILLALGSGMQMGYSIVLVSRVATNVSHGAKEPYADTRFENAHKWAIPLGASIAVAIVDGIGRRTTLLLSLLPSVIGWTLLTSSTSSFTLILGQLLNGISLGMKCGPIFVYISECANAFWRAWLLILAYTCYYIGQVIVDTLRIEHWDDFQLARIELVPPLLTLIILFLSPESPFWLTWSGKNERAFHELRRLRGNDALAQEELAEIVEHLQQDSHIERNEMESIWEICTRLTVLKPLVIICVIQTLALISYTYMHIVTAVVSLDAWSFLEDTVGKLYAAFGVLTLLAATSRRFTFITAGAVAAANIFFYGFYLQYEVDMSMSFYVHRIVALIYHTSGTAFDIAVMLVIAELLPGRVRGSVSAYIFALYFLVANCLSFVSSPSTLVLETWPILTAPGIFIVLALATMAGTGLIYMWMPETKGKTLTDIEAECRVHRWFYDKRRSDCKPVNIEDVENVN